MDLEIITVSEIRERQIPYDITYRWNLKKKQYKKTGIYKRDNKDLLYSLESYIEYLIITYNGKEPEKEQYIYT